MLKSAGFRSSLASLWLRLTNLAIIGLVFAEALFLGRNRIQGWTFYLTSREVVFEIAVRLLFGALVGMALASILVMLLAPLLYYFHSSRGGLVEWVTRIAVVLVLFPDSRYALTSLIQWSGRGVRFTSALLVSHFLFFVVAMCIPRLRRELVTSLDGFLGERMMRAFAVATLVALVGLVSGEFAIARSGRTVNESVVSPRPKNNILLITFDAFTAEDMSTYGFALPITPNVDAFARKATVFTNFYAGSTSTTPCIGVIVTGEYSSESKVYGLAGQVPAENAGRSLPQEMRAGGYETAAFLTNPWAFHLANSLENGFEVLPEPTFHPGGFNTLWEATRLLHQDSRIGSRIVEYFDLEELWNWLHGIRESHSFRIRPDATFKNAEQLIKQSGDGFFIWVHVIAPHHPYLPDTADQGKFIPEVELQSFRDEPWSLWKPHYAPSAQSHVDRRRLAYDEYILTTDRAFGHFMADLETSGRLRNTTVIVSADHGESFEGGIYQHQTPDMTRPVIHVPLIIKTPGQQDGQRVSFTADQTSLAPTILDLAGVPKPDWMHGQSLVEWLRPGNQSKNQGLAFTQYLERNSVFRPLHHGTLGVIDGQYQYVFYLDTQRGVLRPLERAQTWDLDESSQHPDRTESLRAALHEKFPDIVPAK